MEGLIINTPAEQIPKILNEAKENGICNVWLQQAAHSKEAIKFCEENIMNYNPFKIKKAPNWEPLTKNVKCYIALTSLACGPLGPSPSVNSTFSPSSRDL